MEHFIHTAIQAAIILSALGASYAASVVIVLAPAFVRAKRAEYWQRLRLAEEHNDYKR